MSENAELIFLGSGTSMGVPTLGCPCAVCHSADPHNNRMRASIAIQYNGKTVLIDTGPDFRTQALRFHITAVDAVLYTHGHADHILGFDDLRPLTFGKPARTPLYADDPTATTIERIFDYTFNNINRYPTSAKVDLHRLSAEPGTTLDLFGATFERIPVLHGRTTIAGYRFGTAAYLTDMSDIPEASFDRLRGLDIVVLDALRREPHPSHSHLDKSIAIAQRIGAKQTYFTHISHDLDHGPTTANLPPNIHLAHDGLRLPFNIADSQQNTGPEITHTPKERRVSHLREAKVGSSAINESPQDLSFRPDPELVGGAVEKPAVSTHHHESMRDTHIPGANQARRNHPETQEPTNAKTQGPEHPETQGQRNPETQGPRNSETKAMSIYRSLAEIPANFGPSIVTIGNFDGLHCGHQTVIREVVARARQQHANAILVTLDPHPAKVLRPDKAPKLITPIPPNRVPHLREAKVGSAATEPGFSESPSSRVPHLREAKVGGSAKELIPAEQPIPLKLELMQQTGLDAVLLLPFTEEFSRTSPRAFCETVLRDALGATEVHEGENFRFGYAAEADMHSLESLGRDCGFTAQTFAPLQAGKAAISSSRIRQVIAAGNMAAARHMLGRSFSIDSTPAKGRGYGTQYAVPTINLAPYNELLPANGVYITELRIGPADGGPTTGNAPTAITFEGVTNIGNRPTFGADSFAVETYLLNFKPIALDETTPLRMTFLHRLREEKKWPTPQALKQQITLDIARAERYSHLRRLLTRTP